MNTQHILLPRFYKYYAVARKFKTPEDSYANDCEDYVRNPMTGYISWINKQLRAYKEFQETSFIGDTLINIKKFDRWLELKYGDILNRPFK